MASLSPVFRAAERPLLGWRLSFARESALTKLSQIFAELSVEPSSMRMISRSL